MLRRTSLAQLRVLCLTMLPDGGAMTPALKQLGYTPYTLRSSFQQGHASTHPLEWSKLFDGTTQTLPPMLLADYDSVVGPPGAMLYTTVLRQSPQYTKVILVEEPDKDRWAADYEAYMGRLQQSARRTSQNRIARAFRNMLAKMVVGGEASGLAYPANKSSSSSATAAPPSTGASQQAPSKTAAARKTASSADLRRAFAAEAAAMQGGSKGTKKKVIEEKQQPSETEAEAAEGAGEGDGGLQHPRAIALQLYEESVKMSIPPSQLLVYRYGDGWEPLCTFLEKAVPTNAFPDYDDGLWVLGNLQERIDYAHMLQYLLGGVCVVCVALTVLPRCTGVTQFVKDLYTDYQVAFGADSDAPAAAVVGAVESARPNEGEKFEEEWRRRGGSVTRMTGG